MSTAGCRASAASLGTTARSDSRALQARSLRSANRADTYLWAYAFIRFRGLKHPAEMGGVEVEAFLTHLAAERQLSLHEEPVRVNLARQVRHVGNGPGQPLRIPNADRNRVIERVVVPVHLRQRQRLVCDELQ